MDVQVQIDRLVGQFGFKRVMDALAHNRRVRARLLAEGPMGDRLSEEQAETADNLADYLGILANEG